MGRIKHSQSTQSNKFAISLQYLKKKLEMEFIFCMQINTKVSTSWYYRFKWKWLDMFKVPKIENWQYFFNQKKRCCNCFCVLLWCKFVGWVCSKINLLDQGTLKSGVSYKWFDELSRLIEWFLYADSDWITFGLTTNLFCVLDICWASTAVVDVKNDVLLLVRTRKVLELGFPKCFLIKTWLSVKRLFPILCNT